MMRKRKRMTKSRWRKKLVEGKKEVEENGVWDMKRRKKSIVRKL